MRLLKLAILFIQVFFLKVTTSKAPFPETIPGAYIVEFADKPDNNVLTYPHYLRKHC